MITFLSRKIADFLFQRNVISEEYVEICQYGYEVLFFNLFNALIVLVLGIIWDKLLCSVVFFVVFALLRQYCGGYHSKSTIVCTSVYIGIYLFVMFIATSRFLFEIYTFSTHIMLGSALLIAVFLFAPVQNANKPLEEPQKRKYKRISVVLSIMIVGISIIAYQINLQIAAVISLTLFAVMILMVAGMYGGRRGERYEQGT